MSTSGDPFTRLYNALWGVLEASDAFTDRVKPGNRIKLTADEPEPRKTSLQDADTPEVQILPGPIEMGQLTSSSFTVTRAYAVGVTSGAVELDAAVFPIEWEIIRAFGTHANVQLQVKEQVPELHKLELTSFGVNEEDERFKRGKAGWIGVILVEALMRFDRKSEGG